VAIWIDIGYNIEHPLYRDVDISFQKGEIINIIGDNGSGKSTFYRTLSGTIPPLRGQIPAEIIGACAVISDDVAPPKESRVSDIYDLLGGVSIVESRCPEIGRKLHPCIYQTLETLSSGQRRMLEIASALVAGKKILIFDEAFGNLDFSNREMCIHLVRGLKDVTIFNTSHNLEDVVELGGKIIFLDARRSEFVAYTGARTVECIRRFMASRILLPDPHIKEDFYEETADL
jgi:ABC-type multidrug transport system ATPase subunit